MKTRDPILDKILAQRGSVSALSRQLGITRQAISFWRQVPLHHIKLISKITGIPREKLRPDLYD